LWCIHIPYYGRSLTTMISSQGEDEGREEDGKESERE
jgi:hypothetical protein